MDSIKDFEINSPRWLSLENFEGEVWKDIDGYEDSYQVSNLGRVKTKKDKILYKIPCEYYKNKKIIILREYKNKNGYIQIRLRKNGRFYNHSVHRIVAATFIPNPRNLPDINHRDENKSNNCANNLEWCNATYNNNYGTCKARSSATLRQKAYNGTPVLFFDNKGELLSEFPSISEASRYYPISRSMLKKNKDGAVKGDIIFFHKDSFNEDKLKKIAQKVFESKVIQLTKDGSFVKCYDSIHDASKATGVKYSQILWCCLHKPKFKTGGGYIWIYNKEYVSNDKMMYEKVKSFTCRNIARKKVYQFDADGNFIASYNSVTEAMKATNISKNSISEVCNEKRNVYTAGGCIWSYTTDKSDIANKIERLKKSLTTKSIKKHK